MIAERETTAPGGRMALRDLLGEGTLHFMGIGGAGMCALAEAVVRGGGRVTGCDLNPPSSIRPLERLGVRVYEGHDPAHVQHAVGVVVSAAVPPDHPELTAARDTGLPIWKRAAALGEWVDAGEVVAVSGTHGKTTTTAMLAEILAKDGRDPTGFVGGWMPAWQSHLRPGGDELFVVEADEYDRSFHHLRPSVAVVTNMDADHLDIYGDIDGVRSAFVRFLNGMRDGGTVVVCADDPGAASLITRTGCSVRSYGFAAGCQLRAVGFEATPGGSRLRVEEDGHDRGRLELRVPGRHNAANAMAAIAAARALGAEWSAVRSAFSAFGGVQRRFQMVGEVAGVRIVDDYAHHPRELDAALSAARGSYPDARLVAVFQPHLYTRTRDLAAEFGDSLAVADVVWVTDVYPAREPPIPGVDGALVAAKVEAAVEGSNGRAGEVRFHASLETLPRALVEHLRAGDVCLTLGAGSIERVGREVLKLLEVGKGRGSDA